jgi:hypothetical protein
MHIAGGFAELPQIGLPVTIFVDREAHLDQIRNSIQVPGNIQAADMVGVGEGCSHYLRHRAILTQIRLIQPQNPAISGVLGVLLS